MRSGVGEAGAVDDDLQLDWHAAAARAAFEPFEPDTEGERWAGGFSADGSHLGICGLVDGHTVTIETSSEDPRLSDSTERRSWASELVWRHLVTDDGQFDLPYEMTIERDDRHVTIVDETYVCEGIRIAGAARWMGALSIDGLRVKVSTDAASRVFTVRRCTDGDRLSHTPPRQAPPD